MTQKEMKDIPNYVDLTCTNLMLSLKISLKKINEGEVLEFYSNREQFDNIKKPFSKKGYKIEGNQVDHNKYYIKIIKN